MIEQTVLEKSKIEFTSPSDFLRVSYSSLNLFASCARKFEFTKLYPRRARDKDNFAAEVGTALHRAYQNYLVELDEDKALWTLLESYPHELSWYQDDDYRSIEAAISTLEKMIANTEMAGWEVAYIMDPSGNSVPAIEVPFEIQFKGIRLPDGRGLAVTGFIDAFMYHRTLNYYRTLDVKTHRRMESNPNRIDTVADAKYKYDTQQIPYGIVLEHIQQKPVDKFEVLYYDCFVDVGEPRARLYAYWKDQTDIQEWLLNTVLKLQQLVKYAEMDYFPRTDGGCLSFNNPCFYMNVCQSRNKDSIKAWFLEGQQPAHPEYTVPWIVAEMNPFGEVE